MLMAKLIDEILLHIQTSSLLIFHKYEEVLKTLVEGSDGVVSSLPENISGRIERPLS